ncbi:MAG: bifunctional 4-hydroxy-2-oxoglutarate aldolase/2-dehydro-3-deoxy-phosphogluconate aldolase [Defluviitaleaceae bacterium]|nr:bifunctional 4-hydroxy-2-oxoglutarate aldolase/2-dehydro-3-deoxy-phosphogluconate aldolase [Defluviitaleaceae bacterium]
MEMTDILFNAAIVPVVKIDDAKNAVPLAKAVQAGGLPCIEITLRTEEGIKAIKYIADAMPDFCVGAGTVLTTAQVDEALKAGARFIVSPGFNPAVAAHCIERGVPVYPGCTTPSDMEKAMEMGLSTVKFFPAEASGGLDFLKAVAAPYPKLKFMPTGGINEKNINNYLAFDKIIACGGSWMVKDELIGSGKFDEITALTKSAVKTVMGFKLAHIGINTETPEDALKTARKFSILFDLEVKEGEASVFAGADVECLCQKGLGEKGHIAFFTNNIHRAISYLEQSGFEISRETAKTDPKGKLIAIYLKEDIMGFAIHLLQK